MSDNAKFFRGENTLLKIYQQAKPIYVAGKSWKCTQDATQCVDPVNGEKRDRLDLVTNYYDASLECYQSDQEILTALMASQETADNAGLPLKQTAAILIEHKDGTKAAYMLTECVFGPWDTGSSDRTSAVMISLKIRFRFFKKAQAF